MPEAEPTNKLTKIISHPFSVLAGSFMLLVSSQLVGSVVIELLPKGQDEALQLAVMMLVTLVTFVGLTSGLLTILKKKWTSLGVRLPEGKWLRLLLVSTILYVLLSLLLTAVVAALFPGFNASQAQDVGLSGFNSGAELWLGFLAIVVITPIFEEFIFRGIIFRGLKLTLPAWIAILISSSLFATAHGQWNVALDTFALGVFLAYITHRSNSILPAILLHSLKNGVAFALLFVIK